MLRVVRCASACASYVPFSAVICALLNGFRAQHEGTGLRRPQVAVRPHIGDKRLECHLRVKLFADPVLIRGWQREYLAGLGRCGYLPAHRLGNLDDVLDELNVRRQAAVRHLVVVLKADPHVPAHRDRSVGEGHLKLAHTDTRPGVTWLQHVDQMAQLPQRALLRTRRAHHEPKVERTLEQPLLHESVGVRYHIRVKNFDLRLDARVMELFCEVLHQPSVVLIDNWPKVNRTWRVGSHLRQQIEWVYAPFVPTTRASARRYLDYDVRIALFHQPTCLAKEVDTHRRLQVLVARVDMQHRNAVFDAFMHIVSHLLRRTGKGRVERSGVHVASCGQRDHQLPMLLCETSRLLRAEAHC
mmetsp:Transcript_28297/g.57037  ORF Transcript_28297/g.57037 Transcript_28297/m.57037 type:complete len:356 (+) Transcript_28297:92-1159(+)